MARVHFLMIVSVITAVIVIAVLILAFSDCYPLPGLGFPVEQDCVHSSLLTPNDVLLPMTTFL